MTYFFEFTQFFGQSPLSRINVKHKPAKVALVAVMCKLLAFMHSIVKNNSSWNENLC